jgi:hypothetical protein
VAAASRWLNGLVNLLWMPALQAVRNHSACIEQKRGRGQKRGEGCSPANPLSSKLLQDLIPSESREQGAEK